MKKEKILKISKGLGIFSPDDIAVMTGFDETEIIDILNKFLKDGVITKVSEFEYRYINKIPERRGIFKLIEKPQTKLILDKDMIFQQAAEYFLMNYVVQNCTPSTFNTYKSSIKSHLAPFFGKMHIKSITQQDIKNFIELKMTEKLTEKNIGNCITLLGTMFNKFIEWGVLSSSPYTGVMKAKREKRHNIRILKEPEIKYLLGKSKKDSIVLYRFISLALSTGLKRSEIFALKKEDIDLKNKRINVNKTLYRGKIVLLKVKTNIRQVNISEKLIPKLKQALKNKQENDFIFYDTRLSYYTQDKKLRAFFACIAKQMKFQKFTFDDLRHTYAYNALQQGMSIDYLHKQLGDYSIQATMDKYKGFVV